MMIEVRDYYEDNFWEPIDFYTSALADIPLILKSKQEKLNPVQKRFSSLFNHNSSLIVQSKVNFSNFEFSSEFDFEMF
jgi:hypothetical protein